MCGRFTLTEDWTFIEAYFHIMVSDITDFMPRYNIAPTQEIPVITLDAGVRRARLMRWGLVPRWSTDSGARYNMFNARAETLLERPAYRGLVRRQRCLIPADGFYEWQKNGRSKQPYRIVLQDRPLFAFAGLFDVAETPAGPLFSCTIITCRPNELMAPIHDRMPVILPTEDEDVWLDPAVDVEAALAVLQPYAAERMRAYRVSPAVGRVDRDGPELIAEWQA